MCWFDRRTRERERANAHIENFNMKEQQEWQRRQQQSTHSPGYRITNAANKTNKQQQEVHIHSKFRHSNKEKKTMEKSESRIFRNDIHREVTFFFFQTVFFHSLLLPSIPLKRILLPQKHRRQPNVFFPFDFVFFFVFLKFHFFPLCTRLCVAVDAQISRTHTHRYVRHGNTVLFFFVFASIFLEINLLANSQTSINVIIRWWNWGEKRTHYVQGRAMVKNVNVAIVPIEIERTSEREGIRDGRTHLLVIVTVVWWVCWIQYEKWKLKTDV